MMEVQTTLLEDSDNSQTLSVTPAITPALSIIIVDVARPLPLHIAEGGVWVCRCGEGGMLHATTKQVCDGPSLLRTVLKRIICHLWLTCIVLFFFYTSNHHLVSTASHLPNLQVVE